MIREFSPEEKLLKIIKNQNLAPKSNNKFTFSRQKNKVLVIGIICLLGCSILWYVFCHSRESGNPKFLNPAGSPIKTFEDDSFGKNIIPKAQELNLSGDKEIFSVPQEGLDDSQEEPLNRNFQDKVAGQFNLVGIMGKNEAIIEDVSNNKTYFLHKDEKFLGFKVKEVYSDKVVLTQDNQEVELVL